MISNTDTDSRQTKTVPYSLTGKSVECVFYAPFAELQKQFPAETTVFFTDRNIFSLHPEKFEGYRTIVIDAGEEHKQQRTIDEVLIKLVDWEINKQDTLVGIGGGVITDLAGFAASIYKRGIGLVLVPTSLLAMIDAALGGKNGVDLGTYKNMVGTVYQPTKIWYDFNFLNTLPPEEWKNGMAEMIKHACIADEGMFCFLESLDLHKMISDKSLTADLVERNVGIKMDIVVRDEFDKADRQLLNFGHTIGHAIEKLMDIPHGHAVSIGMVSACALSEKAAGLHFADAARVVKLLAAY
ncbi:MAG: 3-dehydroquinate synthase, partial [Chitinophagaceae bacterium]